MLELNPAIYAYVDLYVKELTTEYQNELIAWSGHVPAERLNIVSQLLDGEEPTPQMERTLGLRLTHRHLVGLARLTNGRRLTATASCHASVGASPACSARPPT